MAAIANLRIDQGASFSSDVTVTNSDGDVVDLTGYTTELLKWQKVMALLQVLLLQLH